MSRKQLFLLILLSFIASAHSQQWPLQLSKDAQITLLTVSPGNELYSAFGHSALRVFDPKQNVDTVFNYGAFHFEPTVDFYWRFVQGRLNYLLSVSPYEVFLTEYRYYDRSVIQQSLELADTQKNTIYQFLLKNIHPENRAYKYDFFYDNCSTRIRDIVERELGHEISFYPGNSKFDKTYRDLVHEYTSVKPWINLGITLMLGYPADRPATGRGYMFLPDYLMFAFDSAVVTANGRDFPFVKEKETVLESKAYDPSAIYAWYRQPTVVLWIIFLPLLVASVHDIFRQNRTKWIDALIYPLAGFLGLFFLFCWFGTDHVVLSWNFNLLWAFPGHIVITPLISSARRKLWVRQYFLVFSVLLPLMLLGWFWLPQPLHTALIPFVALLALRGVVIHRCAIPI